MKKIEKIMTKRNFDKNVYHNKGKYMINSDGKSFIIIFCHNIYKPNFNIKQNYII